MWVSICLRAYSCTVDTKRTIDTRHSSPYDFPAWPPMIPLAVARLKWQCLHAQAKHSVHNKRLSRLLVMVVSLAIAVPMDIADKEREQW